MLQPRKRKANNLAQSLGRMAHVKAKTVTWLKTFDKQVARDAPYSIFLQHVPSPSHLYSDPLAAPGDGAATVNPTPLLEWPSPQCCLPVQVSCSFCHAVLQRDEAYQVMYNYMLPRPFVLTCNTCLKNGVHE